MITQRGPLAPFQQRILQRLVHKYKVKRMAQYWLKRSKKSKQRFYRLKEWSETEKTYIQKLVLLKDQVQKPLIDHQLIKYGEQALIFPNLESMIGLGHEMKDKIDCLLKNWNPINTILAPVVQQLSTYLKIYKDYSNNFKKADSRIQQLKENPRFRQIVTIYNVEDYLIKPVQRPLQYKLFLTDYIKLLPSQHIDKKDLQQAKKKLENIAEQINEFVEKQLRSEKLIHLQNTFKNIVETTREYRCQFLAIHPDFDCRVYVFNDLLLIVKIVGSQKQEKFAYINLCGGSYVVRQPDGKYFKNRLYICGTYESIHLTFKQSEQADKNYNLIEKLISDIYLKQFNRSELLSRVRVKRQTMVMSRHSLSNDYKWKEQYEYKMKLKVQVIGVQKRLYEKEWKFVFAVKIRLGKPEQIYQVVYYEIDQLKELEKYIKEVYPNLKIPSLDTKLKGMAYEDFKNDFTKYFQFRLILIEDFLNFCLRSNEICKKPEYIVFKLRLHESLWDFLNRFSSTCACQACLRSEPVQDMASYEKQKNRIRQKQFQFCIINSFSSQNMLCKSLTQTYFKKMSLEQKILWANCRQHRIDYGLQNRGHFGKKLCFYVQLKKVDQQSELFIQNATINDTCAQIVEEVLLKYGIKNSSDFILVYVHGIHQYPLDRDQYIFDAIKHLQENYRKIENEKKSINLGNRNSLLNAFSRNMDNFGDLLNDYSVQDEPKLYIRKAIILSPSLEQKACEANPERYSLVIGEILRRFLEQTFLLGAENIKLFCALMYGIEEFNSILFSQKIFCNEEKLKKYLPLQKWSLISNDFTKRIQQLLQLHVKPLSNILQLYKFVLKQFGQFGQKSGWITQYFQIQCQNPEVLLNSKDRSLLIGVNYNKVVICRKHNSMNLFEYPITTFTYRVSGDCLFVENDGPQISLYGNSWVFFQQLVEIYRKIAMAEGGNTK